MLPWLEDLSQFRKSRHERQVIWMAGDHHWAWQHINPWLSQHKHNTYVGQAELKHAYLECVKASKPSTLLGFECDNVVFDAHHGLFPDALTAIAGTIQAGGILFLLTPPLKEWPNFPDEFAIGRTSLGYEEQAFNPNTCKRLIETALQAQERHQGILIIEQDKEASLPDNWLSQWKTNHSEAAQSHEITLTTEQKQVFDRIMESIKNPTTLRTTHVITADRGRGKSHLLGVLADYLIKSKEDNGIKYYIAAPNKASTSSVYKHLCEQTKQRFQFLAPERLLETATENDIVFIDEAASLPIPLLKQWSDYFKNLIFATTTHGYEGTGKGFQIRFFNHLNTLSESPEFSWHQHKIKQPVRYCENDPIEKWLFEAFCLDCETYAQLPAQTTQFETQYIDRQTLLADPTLLKQVFALLVQAHYQTKPSDLRDLLDAPGMHLYVQTFKENNHTIVASVCLLNDEGPIPEQDERSNNLHEEIYKGLRRPKGHLIPQVLGHHLGQYHAFKLKGARIVRIATLTQFQQLGLGSKLLQFVIQHVNEQEFDYIGSSYADTPDVTRFWHKNYFKTIRQGNKQDKSSGTQSALVIYGLSHKGMQLEKSCLDFYQRQSLPVETMSDLKVDERNLLFAFIEHSGSFESAKLILSRFRQWTESFPKKASKEFKQEVKEWVESL